MPFPQVGDYGPYADWTEDGEYSIGDIVYHEGYLYQLMGNPDEQDPLDPYVSIGENPKTATFSCLFSDESSVNTWKNIFNPPGDYATEEYLTMRRWRLFDLPAGYYHSMLRRHGSAGVEGLEYAQSPAFKFAYMICVRAYAKLLESEPGEEEGDPPVIVQDGYLDDRSPVTECSYKGYDINSGLNATYSDNLLETGGLIYSFTAIPITKVFTSASASYLRFEFENERSLIWMPNTIAAWSDVPSDDFETSSVVSAQGFSAETLRSMHSSMQTFGRTFTWGEKTGSPPTVSTTTGTTVSFEDNWYDNAADPPVGGHPVGPDPDYATDS